MCQSIFLVHASTQLSTFSAFIFSTVYVDIGLHVFGSIPISGTIPNNLCRPWISRPCETDAIPLLQNSEYGYHMPLLTLSRRTAAFVFLATLAGCATHKDFQATGGSRADGVIDVAYEFSSFETPVVDQQQAYAIARSKCSLWGYVDAEPFGGTNQECTLRRGYGECSAWRVSKKYQCLGNLGNVSAPLNYLGPSQAPVAVPARQATAPYQAAPSTAPAPLSSSEYRERQIDLLMKQNLPYDEYQKRYQAIMAQ